MRVPAHLKSSISCEREGDGLEGACVWILRTVWYLRTQIRTVNLRPSGAKLASSQHIWEGKCIYAFKTWIILQRRMLKWLQRMKQSIMTVWEASSNNSKNAAASFYCSNVSCLEIHFVKTPSTFLLLNYRVYRVQRSSQWEVLKRGMGWEGLQEFGLRQQVRSLSTQRKKKHSEQQNLQRYHHVTWADSEKHTENTCSPMSFQCN